MQLNPITKQTSVDHEGGYMKEDKHRSGTGQMPAITDGHAPRYKKGQQCLLHVSPVYGLGSYWLFLHFLVSIAKLALWSFPDIEVYLRFFFLG